MNWPGKKQSGGKGNEKRVNPYKNKKKGTTSGTERKKARTEEHGRTVSSFRSSSVASASSLPLSHHSTASNMIVSVDMAPPEIPVLAVAHASDTVVEPDSPPAGSTTALLSSTIQKNDTVPNMANGEGMVSGTCSTPTTDDDDKEGDDEAVLVLAGNGDNSIPLLVATSIFKCTPVGLFCTLDDCPRAGNILGSSKTAIVAHLKLHGLHDSIPNISHLTNSITKNLAQLSVTPSQQYVDQAGSKEKKFLCNQCKKPYSTKRSFFNHRSVQRNRNGPCQNAEPLQIEFDSTIYGVPVLSHSNLPVSLPRSTICGPLPETFYFDQAYVSFNQFNDEKTRDAIVSYVPSNESVETYVPFFQSLVNSGHDLEKYIPNLFKTLHDPITTNESRLAEWIESGVTWLEKSARLNVFMVPGNLRAGLLQFDSVDLNEISQNLTFCFREKVDILIPELTKILKFIYRCNDARLNQQAISYKPADHYWVARMLNYFNAEVAPSISKSPCMVQYCLARCFTINQGKMMLRRCGDSASIVAAVLSICRAATCSVICTLKENVAFRGAQLVTNAKSSSVHIICPFIRRCREAQRRKGDRAIKTISPEGNICVNSFTFPRKIWSQLIPISIHKMKEQLGCLFVNNHWQSVLDTSIPINVVQNAQGECFFKWTVNGQILKCAHLKTQDELNENAFQKFCAYMEMALHGFGLGSMRGTETQRLELVKVIWHAGSVYYRSVSLKKYSHKTRPSKEIERKLPLIIARAFLLLRVVVRQKESEILGYPPSKELVKAAVPSQQDPEVSMITAVAEIYCFQEKKPTRLDIRHKWTSLTSIVFPNSQDIDGLISTEEDTAEQAGHSFSTDKAKYSAILAGKKEYNYRRFHQALGCTHFVAPPANNEVQQQHRLSAVKMLYGENGNFRSNEQSRMCELSSSNHSQRHTLVTLGVGMGKSLSWLVPLLARVEAGAPRRMTVVVTPYKFLTAFHYQTAQELVGHTHACQILMCTASDINEHQLPEEFYEDDVRTLPDLLFLTIDALKNLFKYYNNVVTHWANEHKIHRFILDEIHTIFLEYFFRQEAYRMYKRLSGLGVMIMMLSGSIPTHFITPLLRFMRVTQELEGNSIPTDVDIIDCYDKLGVFPKNFRFKVQFCKASRLLSFSCGWIRQLLTKGSGSIHVMVSTKLQGEQLLQALSSVAKVILVTSDTSASMQQQAAVDWANGIIDILITTSIGLVGNESRRCKHLVMLGFFYSLLMYLQGAGRLRPLQRKNGSIDLILPEQSRESLQSPLDRKKFDTLLHDGLVPDNFPMYQKYCTQIGVYDWTKALSCYIQTLVRPFSDERNTCGFCNRCCQEPIQIVANNSRRSMRTEEQNMTHAQNVLTKLKNMCIICFKRNCNGEKCLSRSGQCWICGGKHYRKHCTVDFKMVPTRLCFGCLDHYERPGFVRHEQKLGCEIGKRLRRLVIDGHMKAVKGTSFQDYILSVFANKESWAAFVARYDI